MQRTARCLDVVLQHLAARFRAVALNAWTIEQDAASRPGPITLYSGFQALEKKN